MAKHRIKVTGKRRSTINIDLLAEAIVQTVELQLAQKNAPAAPPSPPDEVAS